MHKPSQQTLVPLAAIPGLLQDLPIPKLRQLGGKFGDELMTSLSIKTVGRSYYLPDIYGAFRPCASPAGALHSNDNNKP